MTRIGVFMAAALLLVGCGAAPGSPRDAVDAYFQALARDPLRTLPLLTPAFHRQHGVHHRAKQILFVDEGHDDEEHSEERRERQCFVKCLAQPVLLDDAGERRGKHNDQQADETHRGHVEGKRCDQDQRHRRLHPEMPPLCGAATFSKPLIERRQLTADANR